MKVKKTPEGWILSDEAFNTLWGAYQYEKERADDAEVYAEELHESLKKCEEQTKKESKGFGENEVIVVTIVAFIAGGIVTGLVMETIQE